MRLHFGDFETFLRLFEEVFVVQPYDVDLPTDASIVDAGANIGLTLLYFKRRYPDAEVIAFEPEEANFQLLTANVEANGLGNVSLHRAALSDTSADSALLYVETGKAGSVLGTLEQELGTPDAHEQRVAVVRLSDYVNEEIDLLKLDVEGWEDVVLKELTTSGRLSLIRSTVIECHQNASSGEVSSGHGSIEELVRLLETSGFDVSWSWPALGQPTIYAHRLRQSEDTRSQL
jgi:FkbM family methyltransferase